MNEKELFLIRSDVFNSIIFRFLSKLYEIIKKLKNQYIQYGSKWLCKIYLRTEKNGVIRRPADRIDYLNYKNSKE